MKKHNLFIFLLAGLILSSCSGTNNPTSSSSSSSSTSSSTSRSTSTTSSSSSSSSSSSTTIPSTIIGVSLSPNTKQTLYVGESMYVKATVSGTGDFNKYVTWAADFGGIINFDEHQNNTYVSALNKGTVTLTAVSNQDTSKSAFIVIEVLDPIVDGVVLSKTGTINCENHDTFTIKATVNGKGNYDKNLSWSTSTSGVVSLSTSSSQSGASITISAIAPGDTILTATSVGDNTKKSSVNIHVEPDFDLNLKMVYKRVTSQDEIVAGERYIIVTKSEDASYKDRALGVSYSSKKPQALSVTRDLLDPSLIKDVVGKTIRTVKLVNGAVSGSYGFWYENTYLQSNGSNDLPEVSTLNESTSWNITVSSTKTEIKSVSKYDGQNVYLKHNKTQFGSYKVSAVVSEVELYKYYSGKEQIVFDKDEITLSTNQEKQISVSVHGFAPTSFTWTSNDTSVVTVTGDTSTGTIHTTLLEGEAIITCSATDGVKTATASIFVHTISYVYDQLEEGKYAISSGTNYIVPSTGDDATPLDISNSANYFDFVKAYEGDNTFYITNGTKYLAKTSGKARICLTTEPAVWTIRRNESQFKLITVENNIEYYLIRKNLSNPWIVETTATNSVTLNSLPTFDRMSVDQTSLVKKTYNYDEIFDPTGLKVYAVYWTFLGEQEVDVTSQVNWDSTFTGNSILGTVTVEGQVRYVEVSGLTITHFEVVSISVDATAAKLDYLEGEDIDASGVVVSAHYKDAVTMVEKDGIVDIKNCTISPNKAPTGTTSATVTVTYKGFSDTYSISVRNERFTLADHLQAGMKVVFAANNREMNGDGYTSTPYSGLPHGYAVFQVESAGSYPNWRFKLIEADSEYSANIGMYLAADGSSKGMLKLVSSASNDTSFEVIINSEDYYMCAYNGKYVSMNTDSYKFVANDNMGYSLEIYSEK